MGEDTMPFWEREKTFVISISKNNKDRVAKHGNWQTASSCALSFLVANGRDTDKDIHNRRMKNQHPFLIHNSWRLVSALKVQGFIFSPRCLLVLAVLVRAIPVIYIIVQLLLFTSALSFRDGEWKCTPRLHWECITEEDVLCP